MSNMRKYKIPVIFEFSGEFEIVAPSLSAAKQHAEQHCGLTLGNVHSTLPTDQVEWSFSCHPTQKVGKGCLCEEPITDQE